MTGARGAAGGTPWNSTLARRSRSSARSCGTGSRPRRRPALPGLADWNMPVTAGGRTHAKLAEAEAHPAYARVGGQAGRPPADLPAVAGGVRRAGHGRGAGRRAERGVLPGRRAPGDPRHGRVAGRPVHHGARHAGAAGVLPAPDHLRRGRVLPGLLRTWPRLGPGRRADPRRGRGGRARHHRAEGMDLGRRAGQPDVPALPDRPGRAQARRALLRADRLHRAGRAVPADQADVRARPSSTRTSWTGCGPRCSSSSAG